MENPFSAAVIAATVEVIVDTKEQVSYQTTKMQREIILTKLKEKGCRITKQRLRLIDIMQRACRIARLLTCPLLVCGVGFSTSDLGAQSGRCQRQESMSGLDL